jgi:hypothetical protein
MISKLLHEQMFENTKFISTTIKSEISKLLNKLSCNKLIILNIQSKFSDGHS